MQIILKPILKLLNNSLLKTELLPKAHIKIKNSPSQGLECIKRISNNIQHLYYVFPIVYNTYYCLSKYI